MSQNLNAFQKNRKIFYEQLNSIWVKSPEYEGIEADFDAVLLLADRILAACQEDLEFNRVINISEHLDELNKETKILRVAEDILKDIELWLKVILSLARPSIWQSRRADTLAPLVREDLDLLSQKEIELDVNSYHQISDPIRQLIFLAYRYRNPLTHSPEDYSDLIKARFLPAGLCALIIPVYKYKREIRQALNGLIVSSFTSSKNINMLSLINSERQKHLMGFRGREEWLRLIANKLITTSDKPQHYIVLHGIEGMGKSALVAKITEELSSNTQVIGRNASLVRKNAPWLPNTIIHFGKQSNQPNEIFDILLAQINTLLLSPIDIDDGFFTEENSYTNPKLYNKLNLNLLDGIDTQRGYSADKIYTSVKENRSDLFGSESLDFLRYRRTLYLALQQVVKEKGSIVLVIDAVDEISLDGSGLEFLPERLPVGVSAILSAREPKTVKWLENNRDVEIIRIQGLSKSEIPVFTGVKNEDGEKQSRFNDRIWKASNGWLLMVLEASKLVHGNLDDLDKVQIDKGKLFERRIAEWKSINDPLPSNTVIEILSLLSVFEPVSPLDLDMIQAFIERTGNRYSRDDIKQSLQFVTSQIEGLDANRIKLALKAFAEYIRGDWLGKLDLKRFMEEVVRWLSKKEYVDMEVVAQFLNTWASPSQTKDIRETSKKLIDIFIQDKDAKALHDIYLGLRKTSKQTMVLTEIMANCLQASAELGNISSMRIYGSRLIDGAGLGKDAKTGLVWLERSAQSGDIDAQITLANRLLDGKGIPQDVETGLQWLLRAVEANDDHAKYIYANRLLEGDGMPQSIERGELFLRELADSGYEQAKFSLAIRLIEGDMLGQDVEMGEKTLRDLSSSNDFAARLLANLIIDGKIPNSNIVEGETILRRLIEKGNKDAVIELGSRLHYGNGLQINVDESILLLTDLANTGDVDAMRILGNILIKGDGFKADADSGKKWLVKAADADDVSSMIMLSSYLLRGKFLSKNLHEGKMWLYKAAETQNPRAMQILGSRLLDGIGLPKNQKEGKIWLQKAIDANDTLAMTYLGRKLLYGENVEENIDEGYGLLRRASEEGDSEGMRVLGVELLDGEVLNKDVEEGESLLRKSAESDFEEGMLELGKRLIEGDGLKKNIDEGLFWLEKAIINNNSQAKTFLGNQLLKGNLISQNIERGIILLREAVLDDEYQAKRILGKFLIENQNSVSEVQEGVRLMYEAIEDGDEASIYHMANMLFEGSKIQRNEKEAKQLLKRLVQMGDVDGMTSLGGRYLYGDGVEKDVHEGLKLLKRALDQGDGDAGGTLGRFYYENGNFEMATMYLIKGASLDGDNAKNNLSFLLRRGEALGNKNEFTINDLLSDLVSEKEPFAIVNYALCFAEGFQCPKDWQKADELFTSLAESKEALKDLLKWWYDYLISKQGDPEGHLVVGWLVRHRFVEDPDNWAIKRRMDKAREGGWDIPNWMDNFVP